LKACRMVCRLASVRALGVSIMGSLLGLEGQGRGR
jgi:hypothetical protein